MKIQKMVSLVSLSILFSHSLQASCGGRELREVSASYLTQNKIILIGQDIDPRDVAEFVVEYEKFPASLRDEMIRKGGKVHLMHGHGVSEDPSWNNQRKTNDNRSWSEVPGAGGAPYASMPTRIVVNRLRDGHGSVNLFLHEHAHSLDSTYRDAGISKSATWKELMQSNPQTASFLDRACGSYCNANERERFAELFAIYHETCSGGRQAMERELPAVASYFRNLTSVRSENRGRAQTPSRSNNQAGDREANEDLEVAKERLEQAREWIVHHGGIAAREAHEWSKENVPKAVSWSKRNGAVAARVIGRAAKSGASWTNRKIKETFSKEE